jgi:hypothetical protein
MFVGLDVPLFRVQANTFFIEFLGPEFGFSSTEYSDNLYGFKLFVIPEFPLSSSAVTSFTANKASNGAGVYFFSGTQNTVLMNVDFSSNEAVVNGGGVFWGSVNAGGAMQQVGVHACIYE